MSREIRPLTAVVTRNQQLAFEVEVESVDGPVTWAVFTNRNRFRQSGVVNRSTGDSNTVYSLVAGPFDDEGGFQLRLYDGRPDVANRKVRGRAAELSRGNFAIVSSPGSTPQIPHPLDVRLVPQGDEEVPVDDDRFVRFQGFVAFLRDDPVFKASDKFPTFGDGPYVALVEAARRYVRDTQVADFDELLPRRARGYLEQREQAEPLFPPIAKTGRPVVPAVELIWNYWEEEGALVQTLNVILARFQNRRIPGRDPLARFDVTPLLSLRNKLWGFSEGEVHRTTVRRRAAEYEYEYGLPLIGRAVPPRGRNVERRSAFLSTFHQVLNEAHVLFKEADDLTVNADAFPLARALRDCHLVLSQGSQNQYGEMAVAARAEFLVMQHLLAEPQMREFLGGRPMTPYPEPWMDRVDSMKTIQGWDDTSVMHYHDLATIGEQLVLTIRLGNWAAAGVGATEARSWANAFRPQVQRYAAAYRSVTGVDLAREASADLPSTLIARKLAGQRRGA